MSLEAKTDPFRQVTCWVDGTRVDRVSLFDRGLAYGHGLFETMRVASGEIPLLERHLARLEQGASALFIPLDSLAIQNYLQQIQGEISGRSGVLKLIITAGESLRGYALPNKSHPSTILQFHEGLPDCSSQQKGVKLPVCEYRLGRNTALAGIKHLNRLDQVLAATELNRSGHSDGIMLDEHQHVIETTSRNLFVHLEDGWLTPDLEHCGVAGVMREFLLDKVFPQLGLTLVVGDLPLSRLNEVTEAFVCNSVHGIWPVTGIGDSWQEPVGEETAKIIKTLGDLLPCFRD